MSNTPLWDSLWLHANIATCEAQQDLLTDAAIAISGSKIAWIGPVDQLPKLAQPLANNIIDANGKCITPGLIDCHTHFIYAGDRASEFEARLSGKTYAEISLQGGGIKATVAATRQATEASLLAQSLQRAQTFLQNGVTTVEVKSGYGLNLGTEVKMLRVAQQIEQQLPITIKRTFLGAHAVPNEFSHSADDYINLVCDNMIPYIARERLATAVDVFCEHIAFNISQTEKVFKTAQKYGLDIKCHAEQLSNSGAAKLASQYNARSVDHLEYLAVADIAIIAQHQATAVLLPGAFYFLKERQLPPVNALRQYQVPIAIASDCNPGTSPISSLPIIMNMACVLFGLTPKEALAGVTRHAARALGIESTHGTLTVGKIADLAIWHVSHPRDIIYNLGNAPLDSLVKNGHTYRQNHKKFTKAESIL